MGIDLARLLYYGILAAWISIPMAVANMAPPLVRGTHPIDMGRNFVDGRRLLGDGKTWEGLVSAPAAGMVAGFLQMVIAYYMGLPFWDIFGTSWYMFAVLFCLGFGAVFGDAIGSFIKRRMGMERGKAAPGMDQYDLLVGTFILLLIAHYPTNGFFLRVFVYNGTWYPVVTLVMLILGTPVVHKIVNIIAYKIGKKDVPW